MFVHDVRIEDRPVRAKAGLVANWRLAMTKAYLALEVAA